jgi:hypothetical protein
MDGTQNKLGEITQYTWITMKYKGRYFEERFLVTNLGNKHIILGLPWLSRINPIVDWNKKTIRMSNQRMAKINRESIIQNIFATTFIKSIKMNPLEAKEEESTGEED